MTMIKMMDGQFRITLNPVRDKFADDLEWVKSLPREHRRYDPDTRTWIVSGAATDDILAWAYGDAAIDIGKEMQLQIGTRNTGPEPSKLGFPLTDEGAAIVMAAKELGRGESLAIAAFAGTGKTTIAIAIAEARPGDRILYLAFTRAIVEEARTKMPANVEVTTAHSKAYRSVDVGRKYRHKLRGRVTSADIGKEITQRPGGPIIPPDAIKETLMVFIKSSDVGPRGGHVPVRFGALIDMEKLVDCTRAAWYGMIDRANPMPITHDGYLKLWEVSGATLNDYDLVIVDESQDLDPVMHAVIARSECPIVLLGDNYQQIYGWRGAFNAMPTCDRTLPLTQSFRFGADIAEVANAVLQCGPEKPALELRGLPSIDDLAVPGVGTNYDGDAFIFRTNAGVFSQCLRAVRDDLDFHVPGGVDDMCLLLESAYSLSIGMTRAVTHDDIRPFESWEQLCLEAESNDTDPLNALIRRVEQYGAQIPALCDDIRASCNNDRDGMCITTAHKAKGLEWKDVRIGDDFPSLMPDVDGNPPYQGEVNLQYVALTRATRTLSYNDTVAQVFTESEQ